MHYRNFLDVSYDVKYGCSGLYFTVLIFQRLFNTQSYLIIV